MQWKTEQANEAEWLSNVHKANCRENWWCKSSLLHTASYTIFGWAEKKLNELRNGNGMTVRLRELMGKLVIDEQKRLEIVLWFVRNANDLFAFRDAFTGGS